MCSVVEIKHISGNRVNRGRSFAEFVTSTIRQREQNKTGRTVQEKGTNTEERRCIANMP